ncbi:transposable element Tc1 transposase [Sistotremastrum suecicum HHB10207 ss-3]|uniref:Transposable element Tc1 transposase n=1 Tax=Sistotremastrum suecicum HHB10207 ss-3 TaxID=1314776 RepID=A0A166C146_9AGAM|nr:transposable element Tc1 transposase [Sistotremastrum suecicum HHB10207 ss-3]
MDWPSNSPDMNIIEHVWARLKTLMNNRIKKPANVDELWEALKEEWENLDNKFIKDLYDSLPRRVAALDIAKGFHTKY